MIDKALISLYPNSNWRLTGDSYEGLDWLEEGQDKPTEEELLEEVVRLEAQYEIDKQNEAAAVQAKELARQSALNKLMALGLTEEEALALGVK